PRTPGRGRQVAVVGREADARDGGRVGAPAGGTRRVGAGEQFGMIRREVDEQEAAVAVPGAAADRQAGAVAGAAEGGRGPEGGIVRTTRMKVTSPWEGVSGTSFALRGGRRKPNSRGRYA